MNIAELKDLLRNYPSMTEKVHNIDIEIEQAKAESQSIREASSITLDGMPHGNALSDPTYQKARNVIDIYDERIAELLDKRLAILRKQQRLTDMLRDLTPDEYTIIEAHYMDGIHWDYVPATVHHSRRTCFRIHDRAMGKLIRGLDFTVIEKRINVK